ncbi:hypothetical protein PCANB_000565 [Pneumocystis canis]|nr:hypothetical protein PCANB_000565 [Pneumocystis canis]
MGRLDKEKYVYDAKDVIYIEIVHRDETRKSSIFHPIYTYQIVGDDEKIKGSIIRDDTLFRSHLNHIDFFIPPGNRISSYNLNNSIFDIFMGTIIDPNIKKIIDNIQIFSIFFIEGASYIDTNDSRWNIFLLYEKRKSGNNKDYYHFIGYSTVYLYYWYSREFFDHNRARIAQFIILPPFQRQGHGGKFYDILYTHFLSDFKIQEITIEDPSEEFRNLRDKRDIIRLKSCRVFDSKEFKIPVPHSWILETQKIYKMALNQFVRCMEIILLERLNINDKKACKDYRFQVKQRIYKKNYENLTQYDKDEVLKKLEETYKFTENDYFRILKSMKTHQREEQDISNKFKKKYIDT